MSLPISGREKYTYKLWNRLSHSWLLDGIFWDPKLVSETPKPKKKFFSVEFGKKVSIKLLFRKMITMKLAVRDIHTVIPYNLYGYNRILKRDLMTRFLSILFCLPAFWAVAGRMRSPPPGEIETEYLRAPSIGFQCTLSEEERTLSNQSAAPAGA